MENIPAGTTRITTEICPNCSEILDSATHVDGDGSPRAGDITICCYYQAILVFDTGLVPRLPTHEDVANFKSDEELWNKIHKCRWIIKENQ